MAPITMDQSPKPSKVLQNPSPSASVLLISPSNEILLLHRTTTSSAFPSAHVFPGGNVSKYHDGEMPDPDSPHRHLDGLSYRIAALRETFEESGILIANRVDGSGNLLEISEEERISGRKKIHNNEVNFVTWVNSHGGVLDTDALIPFTRWITPTNLPKRFTTQMYIYFFPLTQRSANNIFVDSIQPIATHDGGIEHKAALFASCEKWLESAKRDEIVLFPPQFYLMHQLAPFLQASSQSLSKEELQKQRDRVIEFVQGDGDGKGVNWGDKVMSPTEIFKRKIDRKSVLSVSEPGPELKNSGRKGDEEHVILCRFTKGGPRSFEVRQRSEVLEEQRIAEEVERVGKNGGARKPETRDNSKL